MKVHKALRRILPPLLALVMLFLMGCGQSSVAVKAEAVKTGYPDADFETSSYKHITNGGIGGDDPMPYNVDAISGATVTVEGPAIVTSIPLSVRELENRTEGLYRGTYTDSTGTFIYEGVDLYYLLHDMVDGDNGIILTDKAYSVLLKDSNRRSVAVFTLSEVTRAHEDGRPIVMAYGIGTTDGKTVAPFVFDAANPEEHSAGFVEELQNDDGCLKLVYDLDTYGKNGEYTTFSNVAYVYVQEETTPGFKHTGSTETFITSRYTDYIVSFRGEALGCAMDFTVSELEALVRHNADGTIVEGGVGYKDTYSLANNAYWYVNTYEGLDLYKLLKYMGMDDAETMGLAKARTTLVSFVANDGVPATESFSVDTLSYPDAFGFYEKNAADQNDGTYVPTNADLVQTGYPVLIAYGVNEYPYTIQSGDDGFLSGLSNNGGPVRVVFGKTQYNHANGSYQVQYLRDVIVGNDKLYNTHLYTDVAEQNALSDNELQITVVGESGDELINTAYTVGQIEDLLYGEEVSAAQLKAARVKEHYPVATESGYESGIYEGVDLSWFLMNELGLPGTNGTVTFYNDTDSLTVRLSDLFRTGYNAALGRDNISPALAFCKNGSPLVEDETSAGYVSEFELHPMLSTEADAYTVDNKGGPLAILLPSTSQSAEDARSLLNVTGIRVELISDSYAHIDAPYSSLSTAAVTFSGDGLNREATFTVADLEGMQTKAKTLDYSVLNSKGTASEQRYRGIPVYDLFTEIGIKSNAGEVIVTASDGTETVFSLSQLKKTSFTNYLSPDKSSLCAMLAFGTGDVTGDEMEGLPLVKDDGSAGYDEAIRNSGGPIKLVVPQQAEDEANASMMIKDVVSIEVTANILDTWSHAMSDVFEEFLDYEFTFSVKNDDSEWSHVFTLSELESMKDLIYRGKYNVLEIGECEGIAVWDFILKCAGNIPGIQDPVAITVYASDGYKNNLLSVFYKEGFELGIADEDGNRKPILLAYALNGCPCVDDESHEGYTGLAGNTAGPLRVVCEGNQGASVKMCNKLVVTIAGSGPIQNAEPVIGG